MPFDKDTITIDGVTMTIDEYLAKQEKKNKKNEIERQYEGDKNKYRFVKFSPKKDHRTKKKKGKVIWSRKYTKFDIKREEEKMGLRKGKKSMRERMFDFFEGNYLPTVDNWTSSKMMLPFFSEVKRTTLSSTIKYVFDFLNEKGLAIKRKTQNGYEYKVLKKFPPGLKDEFKKWSKEKDKSNREKRFSQKKKEKESTVSDQSKTKTATEILEQPPQESGAICTSPTPDDVIYPQSQIIPSKIEMVIKVIVSGKINVAFFSE